MEGTNAAATLSLEISTKDAAASLAALALQYRELKTAFGGDLSISEKASAQIVALERQVASVTKEMAAMKAAYANLGQGAAGAGKEMADGLGRAGKAATAFKNSLSAPGGGSVSGLLKLDENQIANFKGRLQRAGLEGVKALEGGFTSSNFTRSNQVIAAFAKNTETELNKVIRLSQEAQRFAKQVGPASASIKYGDFLSSGEAETHARVKLGYLRLQTLQMEQQAALQKLNDSGAGAAALQANLALRKAELEVEKQKAALQKLNDSGAGAAALQANLDILRQQTRELSEQSRWLALNDRQRAAATLQAARALYTAPTSGPATTGLQRQAALPGLAGGGQALLSAQALGGIKEAEAAYKALGPATSVAAGHQSHWNKLANEGHAAARGLAGAVGGLWLTYGSLAPLLAGAAIAGGFKAATKAGSEFAYQLEFVKALGGESAEAISSISKSTLEMSSNSLHSPLEMANGLRVLAQAGLDAKDALLALPTALDLATVGELDMESAAITLTGVMNAFSLQVTDMGHIGDVFAKAAALSQTSVVAMTQSMRTASVVGEQYGASMEETATALTLLAKVNITGTAAGTSLRNMLKELYAPTAGASKVMKQLGLEVADAQGNVKPFTDIIYDLKGRLGEFDKASQINILQKLFGERGAKEAIVMLSQTREEWDKLKNSLENSDGFITGVAAQLEQTTKGRFQQALNTMQGNLIKAFDSSEGSVRSLADSLKDLANSDQFKTAINGIVSSVAALAEILVKVTPYLIEFGAAFVALKGLSLLAGSVVAVTTAIGGLGRALTIVTGTMATTGGTLAGLRAGLLATSSAAGVAAGATGLGALSTIGAALFSPAGLVALGVAAVGALAYAMRDMADGSNAATRSAKSFADALERETSKLDDSIALLRERNRLQREGANPDDAASNLVTRARDTVAKDLKTAQIRLAIDTKSSDGSLTDIRAISQGRDTIKQLTEDLKRADDAMAKGRTLQLVQVEESVGSLIRRTEESLDRLETSAAKQGKRLDGNLRATIQVLKGTENLFKAPEEVRALTKALDAKVEDTQQDLLGAGNKKFTPDDGKKFGGTKTTRLPKDYDTPQETSKIDYLQQEQRRELALIESKHSNKLISEEKYQLDVDAIYKKHEGAIEGAYGESLSRLASLRESLLSKQDSDEFKRADKNFTDQLKSYDNFLAEKTLRTQSAADKEEGIIKASRESIAKIIAEQEANTAQIIEGIQAARDKLDLTPVQSAGYDAKRASEKTFAKPIADAESRQKSLAAAGYEEESTAMKAVRAEIELLLEAKARLGAESAAAAEKEAEFAREYATGWKSAYKQYVDDATNAARLASDQFQTMSSHMTKAFDTFLETGKLNFADFAKGLILDMAKLEAEALKGKLLKSIGGEGGGGGFGGIVSGILGMLGMGGMKGGVGTPPYFPTGTTNSFMTNGVALRSAKGNVFSGSPSLHQYANTVQSSPKTFGYQNLHGFAKGGVFAEAGPEAVMPLTRDQQGRLGVKAQGGGQPINITVHVNGNSNAPDVRRAAGQGAREALNAFNGARRYA